MDSETNFESLSLLYRILSFKCKLTTKEIKILMWRCHCRLKFKDMGKLLRVSYQAVSEQYLRTIKKIRASESTEQS